MTNLITKTTYIVRGSKSICNCNNSGRIIGTEVAGGIVGLQPKEVTNMLGQKVMECSAEGPTRITLPAGVYLLRLSDGKTATTAKIVVY